MVVAKGQPCIFGSWEDLAFLRANWDGPIVLKGIQMVKDAHAAMDAHMNGVVVLNHSTCSRCLGERASERVPARP
jgi:isopentenyl diphosphate isomerase/L-lactate dehydrogenase-like FMN-dependent dehydrogenase